jgi:hypothetical protein
MTRHRLLNLALAALIAIALSTSYLLDGPDDIATERLIAEDLASIQTAQVAP